MKKIITTCALLVVVSLLFISCYSQRNKENQHSQQQSSGKTMTRVKTPSGLEYEILREGTEKSPAKGQTVTVHYTGWLDNNGECGAKFDSSLDRGTPFQFPIGMGYVIQGWDEGVMGMKIGEKRRLFIPSNLGYGDRGAGRSIPPRASLIFDVELLSIS